MATCYRFPSAERCVNCGWNMRTNNKLTPHSAFDLRVGELPSAEKKLLTSWLLSVEDLSSYPVCRGCVDLLHHQLGLKPVRRHRAHMEVCAACGDSIRNARARLVDFTRAEDNLVLRKFLTAPHCKGLGALRVCHTCSKHATRAAQTIQREDTNRKAVPTINPSSAMEIETTEVKDEMPTTIQLKRKLVTPATSSSKSDMKAQTVEIEGIQKNIKKTPVVAEPVEETPVTKQLRYNVLTVASASVKSDKKEWKGTLFQEIKTDLLVIGYNKMKEKSGDVCIACDKTACQRLKLTTRQELIIKLKLYVPSSAKVCKEHQKTNNWQSNNLSCRFTGDEMADMVFLLKEIQMIDFSNFEALDPFVVKHWLGISLVKYQEIMKKSILCTLTDGKFAAAVFFANAHTGECDAVLSSASGRTVEEIAAARKLAAEHITLKSLASLQKNTGS